MAGLTRRAGAWLPLLLLASCVSVPPPQAPVPVEPPSVEAPPADEPLPPPPPPPRTVDGLAALVRQSPVPQEPVSPLDLEAWPFGWVSDAATSLRLGLPVRFWSEQKPRWREALLPSSGLALKARRLGQIAASAGTEEEELRAAWLLVLVNREAGLGEETRRWLDRAFELSLNPSLALERSWDQAFRLQDEAGARALWPGADHQWTDPDLERKARLLRARLFVGQRNTADVGADGFLSTQLLDRDDLWGATWNGAVVRWSLTTNQLDLLYPSGPTVSPIKLLAASSWFLYAFQDQALLRYSKVTGTWRTFPYPPDWNGLRVQAAVVAGEESLWVASLGQGLWRWDKGTWSLVDAGGGGPFLNAMVSDGKSGFWIGTKDRGLWSWSEGVWTSVPVLSGTGPTNVSVVEPSPDGQRWLVGTWGEGTWLLRDGVLERWSPEPDYVTAAAWADGQAVWGALDVGLVRGQGASRQVLGPRDGIPPGGVSSLTVWDGRWIWGTMGQGWAWWSEYENPALLR